MLDVLFCFYFSFILVVFEIKQIKAKHEDLNRFSNGYVEING